MRRLLVAVTAVCFLLPAPIAAAQTAGAAGQPPTSTTAKRAEIKVPEKVLKTYVGEYEFGPERVLAITLESGSLWGQPTGQPKRQLFAESPTKFYLKDAPVELEFKKDAKGAVTGVVIDQEGRPRRDSKKLK